MTSGRSQLLFESPCAEQRLRAAAEFLRGLPETSGALIVAPTQASAQWLVARALEREGQARFNWHRRSFASLVDELSLRGLLAEGRVPLHGLGRIGLCTRVTQALLSSGELGRYAEIAQQPGFVRALSRTLSDLRAARATKEALEAHDPDLARLLGAYEADLAQLGLADAAARLQYATRAAQEGSRYRGLPLLLLDVALSHSAQAELVFALSGHSAHVCATLVRGDERSEFHLRSVLPEASVRRAIPETNDELARLKLRLFESREAKGAREGPRGSVTFVSSPGEGREAVEVARAIVEAAAGGLLFDQMAIALRSVEAYRGVVEEALRRADVPAHFADGVSRPLPEGRALLLLIECAREGFSARAFSEYLSLFVFPRPEDEAERDGAGRWERLFREAFAGGSAARVEERLSRHAAQLQAEAADPHADAPAQDRAREDGCALEALRAFVGELSPLLEALGAAANWGELLRVLERLSTLALADGEAVREVLRELLPLSDVGPVSLTDAQRVLSERLVNVVVKSKGSGVGKVFVGTPAELRGRSFARVFVLGLSEQMFPPRLLEDPLLPDRVRRAVSPELALLAERASAERLSLRISVGAAREQVMLSYPRFDAEHGRPRVPSFYGLEVLHAVDGTLPAFDELARRASPGAAARMGFPAPDAPEQAIDATEYDLAVLGELLRLSTQDRMGGLRYLLSHADLARALRFRARRWSLARFTGADGFVAQDEQARALLAPFQLDVRAYSATSLAQLAVCPYRFYLHAICGLRPRESGELPDAPTARERGVLMHRVQERVLSTLRGRGLLPLVASSLPEAERLLKDSFEVLTAELAERRSTPQTALFSECVSGLYHDLCEWLRRVADEPRFVPAYFELGFGVRKVGEGLDARSSEEPVALGKLRFRGVIDLVERAPADDDAQPAVLRVTDHKSGAREGKLNIVNGARILQPLLYALAVEKLFPEARVESGRLYFCTSRGDFQEDEVRLDSTARAVFTDLVAAIDQLLSQGLLPAAPAKGACESCAYLRVCGPYEEKERVPQVKSRDMARLAPLFQLRNLP